MARKTPADRRLAFADPGTADAAERLRAFITFESDLEDEAERTARLRAARLASEAAARRGSDPPEILTD